MINNEIHKFLENAGPIFFVTPYISRAIGLEKEIPDFHIVCSQKSDIVGLMEKSGVKIFCLDKNVKNSGKLLASAEVINYIKNNSVQKKANIITFKPSPMIEKICEKNSLRYLGNRSNINREWEDKVRFAEITNQLGVPNANSRIIKTENENLNELTNAFDFSECRKYIIQFSRGYSGNSTFIADNREVLRKILKNNIGRRIKIADFKKGDTYTFDVCIGEFGTLISQPIFQITGFTEFNKNILGTCGNDYAYGKNLDEKIRTKLEANIRIVSDKLLCLGYRGVLGFDFVVGGNEADLIEVNPRLVGSIPAFTKLQLGAGEIPFLLLQILSFLDYDFQNIKIVKPKREFEFSQVILRNNQTKTIVMEKILRNGIYKFSQSGIEFMKDAYCADGIASKDEFFLDCASKGESVDPDMEYAGIQIPRGIMEKGGTFMENFLRIKDYAEKNIIFR
jgi:hypothetical protein